MRCLSLVLLALSLLLAGCTTTPPSSVIAPAATLPTAAFAKVVSVIDPSGGQGEPSLGVAPDGTLYANGLAGTGGRDPGAVYQSLDNGSTWKRIGTPTAPMPNFDPDLAVSHDGTVWFSSLWLGCSSTGASKDAGKTWTTSYAACVPAAGDRQYVVPTKAGGAYIYSHHVPTLYQTISRTTDYGATWTPVGVAESGQVSLVTGNSGWGGGGFYNEAKDSVFLTFTNTEGDAVTGRTWHPAASILHKGDSSFTLMQLPNAGGDSVGLSLVVGAADKAGNVYLSWAEAKGKDMTIYMASSKDDGKTWSKPVVVDNDSGSKVFPAIAAGDDGRVAIAYYHADKNEYPSSVPKDARWNVTLAWTADALNETPTWERANLSTHSVRTGPICPDGTTCQGNRNLLDYFALKITPEGRVASVWTSTDDVQGKTVNVFGMTELAVLKAP